MRVGLALAMALCGSWGAISATMAAPALTEVQRAMLDDGTTDDDAALRQPGLYALLRNAAAWDARDERGAAVPDYDALYAQPASHRGAVVLIEGTLLRSGRRSLDRQGPWGDAVTEWVVEVSREPADVATLLMHDPQGAAAEARRGTAVRVPARFYKVWRADNAGHAGGEGRFLVFVAPAPASFADRGGGAGGGGAWLQPLLMFALVVLALAILWMLRRAVVPKARPLQRERDRPRERDAGGDASEAVADDERVLPEDPAEAMRELAEHRGE